MDSRSISTLPAETLANILRFLPARSLVNSLLVCRSWKELAQRELSGRKRFVSRVFECQEGVNSRSVEQVNAVIQRQILEFLNDIDIVPSAVVVSSSRIFNQKTLTFTENFLSEITANLPRQCVVVGARQAGGMIGESSSGKPLEIEGPSKQLSILFIPKVKGVNVHLFKMAKTEMIFPVDDEDNWRIKFEQLVDKDVKFLFLIGKKSFNEYIDCIWLNLHKILGEKVVVTGGLATPFAMVDNKAISSLVMGLAIGGNVDASYLVRDEDREPREDIAITSALQNLPGNPCLAKPSACFITSCVDRESIFYCDADLETSEFRKAFPDIKIFGFHCFGEIGAKEYDNLLYSDQSLFVMHYFTSVFSILTLNP